MFKKIRLYRFYKNQIQKHKETLKQRFGIKIDRINRMGFVIGIDRKEYELYDEHINGYNALIENKNKQMPNLLQTKLNNKLLELDRYFIEELNISELYAIYEKEQIDDFNYKVIIGFKPFNTLFWANTIIWSSLFISACVLMGGVIAGLLLLLL